MLKKNIFYPENALISRSFGLPYTKIPRGYSRISAALLIYR